MHMFSRPYLVQLALAPLLSFSLLSTIGVASDAAPKSETWFLLSDSHIAEDPSIIARGVNTTDRLKQAISEVLEINKTDPAQGLIVNGDLVLTKGLLGEYSAFFSLIQPLKEAKIPIFLTMGNHDHRNRFWESGDELAKNQGLVPDAHVSFTTGPVANWVFLDSLVLPLQGPGNLGEAQLMWLDRTLAALPDQPTVVVLHHHIDDLKANKKIGGIGDTPAFLAVLDKYPKVKVIIHGHRHRWTVTQGENGERSVIGLPALAYPSPSAPENPVGWVLAHIDNQGMTLELQAIAKSHPANQERFRLNWK